jgi:hypothetical protein
MFKLLSAKYESVGTEDCIAIIVEMNLMAVYIVYALIMYLVSPLYINIPVMCYFHL